MRGYTGAMRIFAVSRRLKYGRSRLCSKNGGFTLLELVAAISIGALLLLFAIAPYNFYADKSRARLSVERVEQAMNKAKLYAGTGFAPTGTNLDLVVRLEKGGETVTIDSIPAGTNPPPIEDASRKQIERVRLESNVTFARIGDSDTISVLDIVYRSPTGMAEVWNVPAAGSAQRILTQIPSSGIVGVKGVTSGALAKSFRIVQ